MSTDICDERHTNINLRMKDHDVRLASLELSEKTQSAILVELKYITKKVDKLSEDFDDLKRNQTIFQVKQGIIWSAITIAGVFILDKVLASISGN